MIKNIYGYIYVCITESLSSTAETNMTWQINSTPIKNTFLKNQFFRNNFSSIFNVLLIQFGERGREGGYQYSERKLIKAFIFLSSFSSRFFYSILSLLLTLCVREREALTLECVEYVSRVPLTSLDRNLHHTEENCWSLPIPCQPRSPPVWPVTHRVHSTAGRPAVAPHQKSACFLAVHNQLLLFQHRSHGAHPLEACPDHLYHPPSTLSTNRLVCLPMALTTTFESFCLLVYLLSVSSIRLFVT